MHSVPPSDRRPPIKESRLKQSPLAHAKDRILRPAPSAISTNLQPPTVAISSINSDSECPSRLKGPTHEQVRPLEPSPTMPSNEVHTRRSEIKTSSSKLRLKQQQLDKHLRKNREEVDDRIPEDAAILLGRLNAHRARDTRDETAARNHCRQCINAAEFAAQPR